MEKEESALEILKQDYETLKIKYSLPEFEDLNKDFYVEKLSEIETDFLVREIRKFLADKFSNYLRFIEVLLHPVNAPMFIFSIVKSFGNEEKKKLTNIYKKLAEIEVRLIELDLEFNEQKEADFIKETYRMWKGMKKDLFEIVGTIKKNWDNKVGVNGREYFG